MNILVGCKTNRHKIYNYNYTTTLTTWPRTYICIYLRFWFFPLNIVLSLVYQSSFSELNSVESTESIEFTEYYLSYFLFKKLPKLVFYKFEND